MADPEHRPRSERSPDLKLLGHLQMGASAPRTLTKYVAGQFLVRFLVMLGLLTSILLMLDVLGKSDEIMAAEGATRSAILEYAMLRGPQLITRFTPFAALLAVLATLIGLNVTSEITVMRAAGMSAPRILEPLAWGCAIICVPHFLFNELVTVRSTAQLSYWAEHDYATDLPKRSNLRSDVWIKDDQALIHAETARRMGEVITLDNVTIYSRAETGLLNQATRAEFARYADAGWTLYRVRRFEADTDMAAPAQAPGMAEAWEVNLEPAVIFASDVVADETSLPELARAARTLRAEGGATQDLETAWLQRFAAPLSSLLMPLMGAVAGFGVHRSGSLFARVVFGMALGFSFFVADNFMVAMGKLGAAPPFLAAFAPLLIFACIGFGALFAEEEK